MVVCENGPSMTALAASGALSTASRLSLADEVVAMCTGALYAAHGMTLKADEEVFKHPDALMALAAELQLSADTVNPLLCLRARAAELFLHPAPQATDNFLAHQGAFISASLVTWTAQRASAALAY